MNEERPRADSSATACESRSTRRPVSGTVSVGPVSAAEAMDMSLLTGDFGPVRVLPQAGRGADLAAPVLHSAWVSGLVGAGLRGVCNGRDPKAFEIVYRPAACRGEALSLDTWERDETGDPAKCVVVFEVRTRGSRVVAEGRAVF